VNEPHPPEHELLLARALAGESDSDLAAQIEGCAVCRERLAALAAVADRLRTSGELQRSVLRDAQQRAGAPGEERVAAVVRPPAPAPARRAPRVWARLAAAALVCALAWLWWHSGTAPSRGDLFLGSEAAGELSPQGTVAEFGTFTWKADLPPGGSFRVSIFDASDTLHTKPLVRSDNLGQPSWTPTPQQLALLPDSIYWEVEVLDAFQQPQDVLPGSASRSR